MKFGYLRLPKGISLPAIPVEIRSPGHTETIVVYALVDSGADHCTLPRTVAEKIGISEIASGKHHKARGVGGDIDCYVHPVEMKVGGAWIALPAAFSPSYDGWPLLGRLGFFDKFRVCIDQSKEQIELHPIAGKK